MRKARGLRSRIYDGSLYARFLDPMLTPLHRVVAGYVLPGSSVLDVGCGTGNLAIIMADPAAEVVGVELSPAMANYARQRMTREKIQNVAIEAGDATQVLAGRPADTFDLATMVLALHEMPTDARGPVLQEATRVAKRVIVVDFRVPLPFNLSGLRNRIAEVAAGPEHFRAFRDFSRLGGTSEIAKGTGLRCKRLRVLDGASLEISEIRRGPVRHPE